MKNEVQKLTDDVSRLYEEINQKTESFGQISKITRLYDELHGYLDGVSAAEVDQLQDQIKTTLERLLMISKNLNVIKALKLTLNGHEESRDASRGL